MKRFIPESLTPLAFTPLYASLDAADRLAYNRLHGLYFLEQTIFFEQIMGRPALDQLMKIAPTEAMRVEMMDFAKEEDAHSSWFRELLREIEPTWYADKDFHLLAASAPMRWLMRLMSRGIRWLPALLWLQLMAEERALYFGLQFMNDDDDLDERFRAVQRRHLADEPGHIRRDELFIRWLWPATPRWLRMANARLLAWLLREFFLLPKRSGRRVVEDWLADRPRLRPRRAEIRQAIRALGQNPAYLRTLYPRQRLPRTSALARLWPEMAFMESFLAD